LPHHQGSAEGVEDQLLRGAGLHACRAGHRLRAGVDGDRHVGARGQPRVRHARQPHRRGASGAGRLERGQHPGRAAAGGYAEGYVRSTQVVGGGAAPGFVVFGAFHGLLERAGAAGDARHVASRRDAEGWTKLSRVERGQSARGAGAEEHDSAPTLPALEGQVDRAGQLWQRRPNGGRDALVLVVEAFQHAQRVQAVEVGRARVRLLGWQAVERGHGVLVS
jgi:hypothetical protein